MEIESLYDKTSLWDRLFPGRDEMNECHISLAFKCVVFRDLLAKVRNKNEMQNNVAWDSVTTLKNQEKLNNLSSFQHHILCICKLLSLTVHLIWTVTTRKRKKNLQMFMAFRLQVGPCSIKSVWSVKSVCSGGTWAGSTPFQTVHTAKSVDIKSKVLKAAFLCMYDLRSPAIYIQLSQDYTLFFCCLVGNSYDKLYNLE